MASSAQVFAVPELLETILLRLPERDLLLSQRVNTTWRNVTNNSPRLQHKLFYKAKAYDPTSKSDFVWNPLLKLALTACAESGILETENESTKASWSDMLLTQPAASEVRVCVTLYPGYFVEGEQPIGAAIPSLPERDLGTMKNPNGVTMDDVWSIEWIWRDMVRDSGYREAVVRFCAYNTSGVPWRECLVISIPSA